MTYDVETLCTLISMELSRFPLAGNHWEMCDPRWSGMVILRLDQVGKQCVPVDGVKFYQWLRTPGLTWPDVVAMVNRKKKQLKQQQHKNNG